MIDWTKSMEQTFEYYIVDPGTWKDVRLLKEIKSSSITRELSSDTLGSASFDTTELLGECYIRVYLIASQNGVTEKVPLGTYLVQTPSSSFDGRVHEFSLDAYTPLLELKEKKPNVGYSIRYQMDGVNKNIMKNAYLLTRENVRAPVIETIDDKELENNFVADPNDTWLNYISDLISNAKYRFDINELGNISFSKIEDVESMIPRWTFNDDNSSILLPEITMNNDIYGIPNVVEIIYTNGRIHYEEIVENNDENSPVSIQNRGRRIVYREIDPNLTGIQTPLQIKQYAQDVLKKLSSIEYTISYKHGYCPVRVGDCVRLNYSRAGIKDVKARVISQNISCKSGCTVSEQAVFSTKLWKGV